jgi:large subunit ribosomal protein L22
MEAVRASLKNHRISAQKARLVVGQVRGLGVEDALNRLSLSNKRFARPLAKLLRSAVANAEFKNNEKQAGIDVDKLIVRTITVDEGPSMWRIRPRAQGRASWVQKRTSHIHVELDERS